MMKFDGQSFTEATRVLPEERAVAVSVGGSTHAVMMATPHDLEDFAAGFLITDGVVDHVDEIEDVTVVEGKLGFDVQVRLISAKSEAYRGMRRAIVGPVGCGLCGIESLELAVPELDAVTPIEVNEAFPWQATEALETGQLKRRSSGAIHGAALVDVQGQLLLVREDIGRHNAVDKVIGAAARQKIDASQHIMVVSSRVSLDLVIKAVRAKIGVLIAKSTPSDLAIRYAQEWNLALIAPVFTTEYFSNGSLT